MFACARQLVEIKKSGCVVLDYGYEIRNEYARKQKSNGQPVLGFQFWKWLLNTKGNADHCAFVMITKSESNGYTESPDHKGLAIFDPSDRKFVAVTVAHGSGPSILQAADSKWWGWQASLKECGITVEFLCPTEIEATFRKKMGNA
jgi:hypothetical protein